MPTNIFSSNFNINSSGDVTNMVSTWGATGNGERALTSTGSSQYYFPSYNYATTINGQIISIITSGGITINTGNAQVQIGTSYYGSNSTFSLGSNQLNMFVLIQGDYWIRIASTSY